VTDEPTIVEVELGASPPRPAFDDVYAAEHAPLVRLAALLLGSSAAAEDVVQDAFAKLHPRFGTVHHPAGWLHTAVVRACSNERRRWGVARRHVHRLAVGDGVDPPVHELVASVRRLPPRQRAVVVLRFYADLTEADIASALGVRVGTVKSSLHRALAHLREEVER
jgi:RNA polymerase sigma-70 factor (sigma-E family)